MILHGTTWHYMALNENTWYNMVLPGIIWFYMALRGTTWHYIALRGTIWNYMELHGTIFKRSIWAKWKIFLDSAQWTIQKKWICNSKRLPLEQYELLNLDVCRSIIVISLIQTVSPFYQQVYTGIHCRDYFSFSFSKPPPHWRFGC